MFELETNEEQDWCRICENRVEEGAPVFAARHAPYGSPVVCVGCASALAETVNSEPGYGVSWQCPRCLFHVFALRDFCSSCGYTRRERAPLRAPRPATEP